MTGAVQSALSAFTKFVKANTARHDMRMALVAIGISGFGNST
jgi:hypothetical protein